MKEMTKKQMAEEILQCSTAVGVSEKRFYANVTRQSKAWFKRAYKMVMESETDSDKKRFADVVMQFLK